MDDREEGEILEYGFLSFPPEVRLKIYNYLFISDGPVEKVQVDIGKKLQGGKTIAEGSKCAKRRHCACLSSRFLQTCSTVKIEALPILLGFNTFHLDKAGDINNIKEIIPPSSYKLIQHLKTAKNGPCGTDLTQEFFTIKRVNQLLAFRTLKSFHYTFTERQGLVPENIVDVESHVAKHSAAVDFTIPLLLKHFSPLQVTTYYYGPVPCTNEDQQGHMCMWYAGFTLEWDKVKMDILDTSGPVVKARVVKVKLNCNQPRIEITREEYDESCPFTFTDNQQGYVPRK